MMPKKGFKFSEESIQKMRQSHLGQKAWNKDIGRCRHGHESKLYVRMPSGTYVCLGCKRAHSAKYRMANRDQIQLNGRGARYGLSPEEHEELWRVQCGLCAICGEILTETARIDHDHQSGVVRGVLCSCCNTGLGVFHDTPSILISAIQYLHDNANVS